MMTYVESACDDVGLSRKIMCMQIMTYSKNKNQKLHLIYCHAFPSKFHKTGAKIKLGHTTNIKPSIILKSNWNHCMKNTANSFVFV